jgi:uncharacterized protein YfbU (UPF0304 family)
MKTMKMYTILRVSVAGKNRQRLIEKNRKQYKPVKEINEDKVARYEWMLLFACLVAYDIFSCKKITLF